MEQNYIKSYLSTATGTEGSLLIPKKIMDTMIEEVDKFLIPRGEAAMVMGPGEIPGSSIDVNLETPNTLDVREVAEGAEFVLDNQEYTSINFKPVKYGVAIRITREMLEDSKWNLLERNIRTAGKRMAKNENSLVISDALDQAANTVTGGAALAIPNITRGMQYLEDSDYDPTSMFIGMEVLNDLRNIDTFVEANKLGSREMIEKGFVGTIFGMNVIKVSSNAGMTSTYAYITDKNEAYAIAEKRTLTVENFDLPNYDMSGATVSHRIKVKALRTSAIAKITTT